MKVVLEVVDGIDKGKRFEIERNEPDNISAGRSKKDYAFFGDENSQLQISGKDKYLSRWHFLLQIRPPNCYIRHIGQTNPTYINDFSKGKGIQKTVTIKHGDVIKAGKTYLKVHICQNKEEEKGKYYCVGCQKEVPDFAGNFFDTEKYDVLCPDCKKKREIKNKQHAQQRESKKCSCVKCKEDITEMADTDGRAKELQDVAMYMCKGCVSDEKEERHGKVHKYILLSKLGHGGMGVVYKAWHKPTGRLVALKKILPEIEMIQKALLLFQREISVMHGLAHPNIVRLYESGTYWGKPYFVCEYLTGGSVEDMLLEMKRPFSVRDACTIILDVLEGLAFAHQKGIVHRDISPANMLFASRSYSKSDTQTGANGCGKVKLSDMGLSKSYELAGQSYSITQDGESAGKLLYMAPEQFDNYKYVKPPADVYSVGVSLYYMLTGKFPYEFPSTLDMIMGFLLDKKMKDPIEIVLKDKPVPIRNINKDIPEPLAQVVDKALNKNAGNRYPSAREMKQAIEKAMETF